jgi:AAA domain
MADLTKELLAAASKLAGWQQDALRRIATGKLVDTDFSDLVALAKAEAWPTPGSPTAVRLAAEHLSTAHSAVGRHALLGIHSVQGVNALEAGQRLDFVPTGISVVFGENGAGKSGYSRLMKRACRARKAPPILPNLAKPGPFIPPQATFVIGNPTGNLDLHWDEKTPRDQLASFAVFDRECEYGIVEEKGEVAFVPPLVRLFDELAQAVTEVKRRVEAEAAGIPTADQLEDLTEIARAHQTSADIVSRARPNKTDPDYLSAIKAVTATTWEAVKEDQLTEARKRVLDAGSPLEKSKALRGLASSIASFRRAVDAVEAHLGDTAVPSLQTVVTKHRELTNAAAKEAAGFDFSKEPADSIGQDAWQALYAAAVAFASGNMRGGPEFPATTDGAHCPLCLRDLDATAAVRFDRFRRFMSQAAKAAAEQARLTWHTALAKITGLAVPQIDPHVAEQSAMLAKIDAGMVTNIPHHILARKEALLAAVQSGDWTLIVSFDSGSRALTKLESDLLLLAGEAEKLATPAALDAAKKTAAALEAEKAVFDQRERIGAVLRYHRKAAALRRLAGTMGTRDISFAGKAMAESAITGNLRQAFTQELASLGASGIRAEIAESASKGKATYGLALPGSSSAHRPNQVLSEGEQRVVALAYFLAEVRMAPDKVGIIVDDPVSSLDHRWAKRIAARLAFLGQERQVIVFTHSIAFLTELGQLATEASVPFQQVFIERTASGAGRCGPDAEPWEKLGVGTRIQRFQTEIKSLRVEHSKSPGGRSYVQRAVQLCGDMRAAWERAVEECVLNDVVKRFGYAVETKRLKGVVCSDATYKAVNDAMTRLSAITSAHDKTSGAFTSCPDPDELERYVKELESFVKTQKAEAKKAEESRKLLESPPAPADSGTPPPVSQAG